MAMKILLLREELLQAGIDYYCAGLDENGDLFVRFLDGDIKRVPTESEQVAIDVVVAAHDPDGLTAAETLRGTKDLAQSAAGVRVNQLTDIQRDVLLTVLLWKNGAIAENMTINPLGDWVK